MAPEAALVKKYTNESKMFRFLATPVWELRIRSLGSLLPRYFKTHANHMLAILHRVKPKKKKNPLKEPFVQQPSPTVHIYGVILGCAHDPSLAGDCCDAPDEDGTTVNRRTEELLLPFICQVAKWTNFSHVQCAKLNFTRLSKMSGRTQENWETTQCVSHSTILSC